MERNVPQELWLYPDRGMKKWLGWILSDHSAYMESQAIDEKPTPEKPEQKASVIDQILQTAWEQGQVVAIQLNALYDGQYRRDLEGPILGYADGQIYLQRKDGLVLPVQVEDIRHIDVLNATKWWHQ
ncbi:DNA-directed RNA polymerase subunit beta [Lacticaseibacillus suilingensis]|uniref:DNA-directed RNA polymerase subunit beta n=1 Tax=Lacticaseibacillus suilingensis TaxID=2799577 RepID=A0ABW4BJA8_9LACO|nr:DNA-directed RNA polymerase subunit beta [Lacticaseibacillus suilingensis]